MSKSEAPREHAEEDMRGTVFVIIVIAAIIIIVWLGVYVLYMSRL